MRRLALLFICAPAFAWDSHGELTRLALRDLPGVEVPVAAETLEDYLSATGKPGGLAAFLKDHKLNPRTAFAFRAGETSGAALPLLSVLAAYVDEPDWEMDNDMFASYPELWRPEYRYMGGREGPQTRAIRHMHWPRGYLSEPPAGSRVPAFNREALGLAPERAELFFSLSRQAFAEGHPYWGGRFLAWSLHYLQDLTQPFHAVQLPAFELLRYRPDGGIDLEKTTRVVVYYHLAIDGISGASTRGELGAALKTRVEGALVGASTAAVSDVRALAADTAMESSGKSKRAALAAADFFPEPSDADLSDPVKRVWGGAYWRECAALIKADPAAGAPFFALVEESLRAFGPKARGLAAAALAEGRSTARIDRARMLERVDGLLRRERAIIGLP